MLGVAAIECEKAGFDEINLNCGCPSTKVQKGAFGAVLMLDPQLIVKCVREMEKAVKIPITVKCRLGVDDCDDYEFVHDFIKIIST